MGELLGSKMGRDTNIVWRRSKLEGQRERFFFVFLVVMKQVEKRRKTQLRGDVEEGKQS